MTADDFRRLALALPGAEEGSHMGVADFRVGGRIFATLASEAQGYGNLMLTPEMQAQFMLEAPELFLPVHGGGAGVPPTSVLPQRVKMRFAGQYARRGSCAWRKVQPGRKA